MSSVFVPLWPAMMAGAGQIWTGPPTDSSVSRRRPDHEAQGPPHREEAARWTRRGSYSRDYGWP